ncbi:protoporphyrinogen oxidase [Rhodobacterales bacterium HKCCE3408]|nr:protoporphyrinogen oxidase [Rhodobacterales bacterium HKCCE3408]
MKLLIVYATTEGQTRKIARHLADRACDGGHSVELLPLSDAGDIDLDRFSQVLVAASVHIGHYQRALIDWLETRGADLKGRTTMFVSVSLAAAGHESDDWRGLEQIAEDFVAATGWTPEKILQVAGAYTPSRYDMFRRFAMRRILAAKDPEADPDADKEYTDWDALDAAFDDWMA